MNQMKRVPLRRCAPLLLLVLAQACNLNVQAPASTLLPLGTTAASVPKWKHGGRLSTAQAWRPTRKHPSHPRRRRLPSPWSIRSALRVFRRMWIRSPGWWLRDPISLEPPAAGDQSIQFSAHRAAPSRAFEGGHPLGVLHRVRKYALGSDVLRPGCREGRPDPLRAGSGYADRALVRRHPGSRSGV